MSQQTKAMKDVEDLYALSPLQEGLLFHSLESPEPDRYLTQLVFLLEGVELEPLERAWQRVVERHGVLRTAFAWQKLERPLQIVGRRAALPIERLDWRDVPEGEREERLREQIQAGRRRGFQLSRAPLMRLTFIRLSEDAYYFIWSFHHILLDGWCLPLLLREVHELYDAIRDGRAPRLAPPRPYRDYISWIEGQDRSRAEAYWRKELAGFTGPTRLRVGRSESAAPAGQASRRRRLSPAATQGLRELARRLQLPLNVLVRGGWAFLLSRYSGENDVLFGAVVSGRPPALAGVETMVGLFINTLPVRVRIPPAMLLADWLRRLHAQQNELSELEYSRLIDVQSWSEVPRGTPLFETILAFENYPIRPSRDAAVNGFRAKKIAVVDNTNYPLSVVVGPGTRLSIRINYDEGRFDGDTIDRMLDHYGNVLESMISRPDMRLADLSLLSAAERRRVVVELNETASSFPEALSAHELFERQARRSPGALAASRPGEAIDYRELDRRSNRLARHLRSLGVGSENVVGILLDRSPELPVGILGVWKAGGAYLALDPDSPPDRLGYMLRDAGARVVVTREELGKKLPGGAAAAVILDRDGEAIAAQPELGLESGAGPENLAYIIYTSGSTGRPKGVGITHRSLVNLAHWHRQVYRVTPEDRATQIAGLGFDASVWEIWPYLISGASVHFPEESHRRSAAELLAWMSAERITLSFLPTPLAEAVLTEAMPGDLALRALLTGGDKLHGPPPPGLPFALYNHYGPTEAAVVATATLVPPSRSARPAPPIGRPLANVRVYVLDEGLQPLPVGVPGQLFIGGTGLARGYVGHADWTAERFIPDPVSGQSGGRLYRTGDRVRLLADGQIEFLGRVDEQIKLRGFRIEPGEIEAVLAEHPAVREAVVILRDEAGLGRLAAYVVSHEGRAASPAELLDFVRERVPAYMVPSSLLMLEAFPLTPNGKIDRRALPAPAAADVEAVPAMPLSAIEESLCSLWAEVLGREAVRVTEDFFALGGHSLLATRLVSRIREAFALELPLRTLFEAPTVRELARRVEAALEGGQAEAAPPLEPIARDQELPLSFAQQRLWFLAQLEPESTAYNIPRALRLEGRLDRAAIERSLAALVERHEALRTHFRIVEGRPVQIVEGEARLVLPFLDLTGLDGERRKEETLRIAAEEAARRFDLERGPLFRAALLRLGENEHVLLLTVHHIVSDGWSMSILESELGALYRAFSRGQPAALAEPRIQYADFAHWQRRWLEGERLERQLSYWRRELEGSVAALDLPTDRARPAVPDVRGGRRAVSLSPALTRDLKELSRREGATLFMTLLAAFQAVLHRYTGQDDISVGTPIANRHRGEVESVVGFFANTLVLRGRISPGMRFRDLIRQAREVALGAYAHQDLPFEKLVEELQPERHLGQNPLFQVLFALQNAPAERIELPDLALTPLGFAAPTARFDLELHLFESGGGLRVIAYHRADLFEPRTVDRMLSHWETLLRAAVARPDIPISEMPLLPEPERKELLGWSRGERRDRPAPDFLRRFEGVAAERPDAPALIFGERVLTYAAVNRSANRLARKLRSLGVGADAIVGISMERSPEIVVSVLAVLKAGGAYLPLDPAYPAARLAFMIEDSGAAVLLTRGATPEALAASAARVLAVDAGEELERLEDKDLELPADPEQLAYVIYTSGSTGRPKGVAMVRGALSNLVDWQLRNGNAGGSPKTLQFASLSFDVSFQEIFATGCAGGALCLTTETSRRDPDSLLDRLSAESVERVFVPFVALENLAEAFARKKRRLALREIVTAGERLEITPSIAGLLDALPNAVLCNQYGPSETHVVTAFDLRGPAREWMSLPPIGRPIHATEVYLLDRNLELVPPGVAGEIYLGGLCLSRGYLNRPDLTAERFLPHPYSSVPGARLYRTGDLGKYLPDGSVAFLGRADQQVKLRGFRVEPGEIEAALTEHPDVQQAVVTIREDAPGRRALVAYVVAAAGRPPRPHELRGFLAESLPDYMIPSHVVFLPAFPLTPSGKVDRLALPAPEGVRPDLEVGFAAPRDPVEEALAEIWCAVLGLAEVGIHDDFFALGGHSLLATRIFSRLNEVFEIDLPLRRLFESPTIAALAEQVRRARTEGGALPPIARIEDGGERPLSFSQERLWFLEQLHPGSAAYNMPGALRLSGRLDPEALEKSLSAIVARHEVLRYRFLDEGGRPRVEVSPPEGFRLARIDLGSLEPGEAERTARRVTREQAGRPFDLQTGPLFRAVLLRMGSEDHVLLLTAHHIVFDGWSMRILRSELSELYAAARRGEAPGLPPLPLRYADYAAWQRRWLGSERMAAGLSYWREKLGGDPPVLELPTDRPRPPRPTFRGAEVVHLLPAELTAAVKDLGRRTGTTLFMTLLAAFQLLLHRCSGQDDIVVGTPVANRNRLETEGLIGFFLNSVALRVDLSKIAGFEELLREVRRTVLEAVDHQDVPLEMVLEELKWERDLARSPVFQVFFNLLETSADRTELAGVETSAFPVEVESAKFDLTLYAGERSGRLAVKALYAVDLFEAETVERMLRRFELLLEQAVSDPHRPVKEYSLVEPAERSLLPDPAVSIQKAELEPVTRSIEVRARRAPERAAVRQNGRTLTYRELLGSAREIAQRLLGDGLAREEVVAVCAPSSFGLVTGMLGVFLSGGVLLTLDPGLPAERKRVLLREARARRMIWAGEGEPEVGPDGPRYDVAPETGRLIGGVSRATKLLPELRGADPAYVFFTSGTTGLPKGILGTHEGLSHFLDWQRSCFAIGPDDRFSQLTSLSFDALLREIFLPLSSGATLCLPDADGDRGADRIASWLEREQITVIHTVPTVARSWAQAIEGRAPLSALRWVFLSGEPLTGSLAERWRDVFGSSGSLVNLYGPTETTLTKSYYVVPDGAEEPAAVFPIGRALPETQILILSETDRLCGIGEVGEIVIRTAYRTRGYLNAAGEQRLRFRPNPFRDDPADLLYYTGDRGRYRADGNLEFLGRKDGQVKVRGARVELAEVESVLMRHPAIGEAAVLPDAGGESLRAYVVARPGASADSGALRAFLKERLPEYMVPTRFVRLDALPRTASGKLDRRALPVPSPGETESVPSVPPRSAVERELARILSELLGLTSVGIYDDFFALGGHSLLATRYVSRIRSSFRIDLPLRAIFEAPRIAELSAVIEEGRRARPEGRIAPIEPASRDRDLPLSFPQQRLWFLQRLAPESSAYHLSAAVRLAGPLDANALGRALDALVARHEGLRTSFPEVDGTPVQRIAPPAGLAWSVTDLASLPEPEKEGRVRALAAAESARPFDLGESPLFRCHVFRLGTEDHVLAWTMHHIISDAWSLGVLYRELGALYSAFATGRPAILPALPIQYADYACWQRERVTEEALADSLAYWKDRLEGLEPILPLPCDRPRPQVQSFRGGSVPLRVPAPVASALKELGQAEGATLFMVLLAVFQVLLRRYSGEEDIAVGTPIAARDRQELEGIIGFFINTLVIRSDLYGDPTFREVLRRVREVSLEAYAHQELPFDRLVEELHPERDLSANPLFQVLFALQNAPSSAAGWAGLTASPLELPADKARFDLVLNCMETRRGLEGVLEYSTDLFERATIARAAEHYERLLRAVIADPDRRVSELPMLDPAEYEELVLAGNRAAGEEEDAATTVLDLFAEQVERRPEATAVVSGEERVSYGELDRRANVLASELRDLGAGPESRIGLCAERSVDLVVGMLAIVKAGAAYVPMDPEHPRERLLAMLDEAAIRFVLTRRRHQDRLSGGPARVLLLDREGEPDGTAATPAPSLAPGSLAYVIFTSGSTGTPKAVAVEHRGLARLVRWHRRVYAVSEDDRATLLAGVGFDASVWEIWPYLCSGASLYVPDEETRVAPKRLWQWLAAERITLSFVPTPLAEALLQEDPPDGLSLRELLTGGDALHRRPRSGLSFRLWNHYGPTENSVVATWDRVLPDDEERGDPPIGRPLDHVRAYVLDDCMNPVPAGVAGELYLGGSGVARGYVNSPEATAESFLPDPFSGAPGARLYRTGDRVRRRRDGRLEFLGRLDQQVKIRGFRIEPGEIESVLHRHPAVRQAAVVAAGSPGGKRLVAYVATGGRRQGEALALELARYLDERLPKHMTPSGFVFLDELPVSPNGKVDRRRLPEPDAARLSRPGFVAPESAVERTLAAIWSEVLHLEKVGIHDNFFELGGDSILSIRVVSRAAEAGLELTARQIFQNQTIAELASVVAPRRREREGEVPVNGAVPLTPIQHWFFEQDFAAPHHFNHALLLEAEREIEPPRLEGILRRLLEDHDALRLRFTRGADGWKQEIVPAGEASFFAHFDLSALSGEAQRGAIEKVAARLQSSLDLEAGPIFRAAWLDLGPDAPARLLLVIHHLAVDGVSWRILLEDLHRGWLERERGGQRERPVRTSSFKTWAELLERRARAKDLEEECGYWLQGDFSGLGRLPLDGELRPERNRVGSAAVVTSWLDARETARLVQDAPAAARVQLVDLLLAALARSLAWWTGGPRWLLDCEGHGREEQIAEGCDLSRTIGWFTTLFPLVLDAGDAVDPGETLRRIRRDRSRLKHNGIGYGILRYLCPSRAAAERLRSLPRAEISFNYLGQLDGATAGTLFRWAAESAGANRSPLARRPHLLEISGAVLGGRLRMDWRYAQELHRRSTIEALARRFNDELNGLVRSAAAGELDAPPASDFTLAELEEVELGAAFEEVDFE